ncbi:MAG TPA: 3-deoxy-manno-octulosonate cytidylyltransferase [Oculatellaceae cyanobacterium]
MPRVLAVIPARYGSTRFPGKPLVEIAGKPMIRHVWERVRQVSSVQRIIIATDDERIRDAALAFGAEVCMTDPSHPSGTDRIWEVAQPLPDFDWILNVQGDEPLINPLHLAQVIQAIQPDMDILTLVTPLAQLEAWRDPNIVKAILAESGRALYFSRSSVPYHRDEPDAPSHVFRHIGLYLYSRNALARFTSLPPSRLEQVEKLEQLRALEDGMTIHAEIVDQAPIGIDTPEDLVRVEEFLQSGLHKF